MTGATHIVLALGTLGVQRWFTGLELTPSGIVMVVVGALAPDLDGQGLIARPGRLLTRWIGRRAAGWVNAPFLLLSGMVRSQFGHRGLLHTPFLVVCMGLIASIWQLDWMLFFAWGYSTHIVGDLCTVSGIPVFGPYRWQRYRVMSVRTGTYGEVIVAAVLIGLSVLWSWGSWLSVTV